jgi:integrase/recombinase XerD
MIYAETRSPSRILEATAPRSVVSDNEQLIRDYLEWKKTHAPVAAKRYAIWVSRFQRLTDKEPEWMELSDWTRFAESLRERYAPKSVQFALNILHNYLRFWHEQGRLRRFPLHLARVPKAIVNSHDAIAEAEYRDMVEGLRSGDKRNLRDLAIVMLLHDTGMRVGELVSLEIEQIEPDASATIRSEKTVERRRVFWNWDTDEVLHELIVQQVNKGDASDWLFTAEREGLGSQPLSTRSVQRIIERTARAAGIRRHLSPHSFRHGFIHRLAALSVPDAIIAQLVGHTTPHTISHYTKLSRPEFREFASRQFRQLIEHAN